uniref:Uncharacterized protein n=1 Tax=Anguilla anguilla TaxID=7936 RepID=A0A0E9XMC1_ANGAN
MKYYLMIKLMWLKNTENKNMALTPHWLKENYMIFSRHWLHTQEPIALFNLRI